MPLAVSCILGSYNRLDFLRATVESLRAEVREFAHEIIIIDGGSTDGSLEWLVAQTDIITIVQHNRATRGGAEQPRRSWGYFMNLGFKTAQGRYVLMVSDDCLLVPGALRKGVERFDALRAQGRKVGGVAFYWRNWPDQPEYWVGLTCGGKMFVNHGLYLRRALEDVSWVDEERYRFYHADGDLSLKMWEQGYEIVDAPDSYVEHFAHADAPVRESNLVSQRADWDAYLSRWSGIFYDPTLKNSGGWVTRAFNDETNTASKFPRAAIVSYMLGRRFSSLSPGVRDALAAIVAWVPFARRGVAASPAPAQHS